jgi:hypothetical protein
MKRRGFARRTRKSIDERIEPVEPSSLRIALAAFWPYRLAVREMYESDIAIVPGLIAVTKVLRLSGELDGPNALDASLVSLEEALLAVAEALKCEPTSVIHAAFCRAWCLSGMLGDGVYSTGFGLLLNSGQSSPVLDRMVEVASEFPLRDNDRLFDPDTFLPALGTCK